MSNWYKNIKIANRDNAILQRLVNYSPDKQEQLLKFIKELDPTVNKEYSDWIAKDIISGAIRINENHSNVSKTLSEFNKLIKSPKFEGNRNIYEYNYPDLIKIVDENLENFSNRETFRQKVSSGIELVLDKEPYKVYEIKNAEGASELCKGTNWCIKDPIFSKGYLKLGRLFFILKNNIKYVVALYENGTDYPQIHVTNNKEFLDENDMSYSEILKEIEDLNLLEKK